MTEHSIEPDDRGLVLACPKCAQRNRLVYSRIGHKFRCAQCHTELSPPSESIEVKKESVFEAVTGQPVRCRLRQFDSLSNRPAKLRPDKTSFYFRALTSASSHRLLVLLHCAWQEVLELADSSRVGRVRRHQFSWLLAGL
jgi:hypothetical protein